MNDKAIENLRSAAVDRFLVQLELRKRLSEIDADIESCESSPVDDAAARAECARHVGEYDGDIGAGQVRILPETNRPTYVLVARRWGGDAWLVLPFSQYAEPATDTEMRLAVSGGSSLCVVQLWNARSLHEQTLAKSWLVATLSEEVVGDALAAWEWSVGPGELSQDQLSRTGLPIMRRDDPRIEYEAEELANFRRIDAEDMQTVERHNWLASVRENIAAQRRNPFAAAEVFAPDYALAAGETVRPVAADCRIPGFDGMIHVRYIPAEKRLHIRVFGADGSRSGALDGWSVFDGAAELLGVVLEADFAYVFESAFDGVVNIVDEEGNVAPLMSGNLE